MERVCFPDEGARCWVAAEIWSRASRGRRERPTTQRFIVDTACPATLILSDKSVRKASQHAAQGISTNYGWLWGYSVRITIPELGFDRTLTAHGSDHVARIARDEGFDGIVGKTFLDHFRWGNGEGGEFCLETWDTRPARNSRTSSSQRQ